MSLRNRAILITVALAVPAFLFGRQIWPPDPMGPMPTSSQLPFFIILSICESLALGLGVAFWVLGWPLVLKLSGKNDLLTKLAFFSIVWYLINWWPHDSLHMHVGMDLQKILLIEYGFHVTMMIAGAILALFFYKNILVKK